MLNLTNQERQVILFLISVALAGVGINFIIKINSRIERFIKADNMAKMDINQASLEDLLHTPNITAKLAKKIIEYRDSQGKLKSIEELKEIKGIGNYRLEKLKDIFRVE